MSTTPALQQEWDQAPAETPQEQWESATPEPSLGSVDPKRLSQALVHSQMLDIPPSLAYDQSDELEKEMKKVSGGGTLGNIAHDIKVGGENSIFGLAIREKLPEPLDNPDSLDKFVSGLSTVISDLPFYLAGGYIGGTAGGAIGAAVGAPEGGVGAIPGSVIGAGVGTAMGAFAIPAGIRETLMQGIQKGDVKDFGDFVERTLAITKAEVEGAATGLSMEAAGSGTLPALGKGAVAMLAKKAQQTAAITILPKLFEGQLPTASDFGVNAALVGALHLTFKGAEIGTGKARQALMDVYVKDGTLPKDALEKLNAQPPVKPDLEPGLKPGIQFTRSTGSELISTDIGTENAATSGKVVMEADEGETHPDLAERMLGDKPVTLEELEHNDKQRLSEYLENKNRNSIIRVISDRELDALRKTGELPVNEGGELNFVNKGGYKEASQMRAFGSSKKHLIVIDDSVLKELQKPGDVSPSYIAYDRPLSASKIKEIIPNVSLADAVLAQSEGQLQQVIDRAAELKKEETGEAKEPPKSGRGFLTTEGRFLSREQAKSWVKKNEPEIYEMWARVTGDEKSEFHADDYAEARERVANRTLTEGDPDVAAWSPQLASFVARMRSALNEIKAGDKSEKYGREALRTLFLGPRNMLRAEVEQLHSRLAKLIPDFHDQEALTFLRDYKGAPDELRSAIEEIRAGDNEKLKAYIPSMEKALAPSPELLQADAQMTAYFRNALGLGRQLGTLESTIDPERYSPRLFTKTLEEEEEAHREGRPRFTARTPHAIRREYLRILDPLKSGDFEARTFNALDELSVYGDRHATAAATSILKTELKNTEMGKNGSRSDVPFDWKELPGTHKSIVTKNAKTGENEVFGQGFFTPKVVSDAMRPILEQNVLSGTPYFGAIRAMQRFVKAVELGLSVFHMKALGLMAWGNEKVIDFEKTMSSDNASPEFEAAEREGALHGLETTMTGAPYEAYKGLKPTSLPSRLDVVRGTVGIKQIDEAAQALTHATFDVIQRKFKVMDFSLKQAAWLAKNPEATDAEYGAAMRSISKEINAVYGGLNWEQMGWGPNAREIVRAFMLAPDWTFSNFANLKYALGGGPGGAAARAFWVKSAATGLAMTAATSLLVSGQLSKHPTEVYLGKDKQGKEIYSNIFFAGAPRDAITWLNRVQKDGGLSGTVDFMAYKAGPLVGIIPRLLINRDWTGKPITTPKQGVLEKTGRQAAFAAEEAAPVPFSIKDIIEGMLNDSERDYSYKDFLLAIAGATARHEGGKPPKKRRFSITGR